ncbi:beta-galactosidase [Streptomyces longispororuber]|uniref:beta-galactosidase n=1 Tax=Streptomyces longispororuber TaxID=68230 RepID=UPI00210AEFF4|nr:beta-galactosidase [Streptomyces longispororuber]MCQ4214464.1 beta-galactosidase [Streptomyces longispororuber]
MSNSERHSAVEDADRARVGTAYYFEYGPPDRLDLDLDLIAGTGLSLIRVGESVWSTWEPSEGRFDLDWIVPVLDGAHRRGIRVLLGTPTYAVPPWLQRAHPEIAAVRADGSRVPWGGRQEVDFTHPVFRRYAERVVRRIVGAHAGHPAVVGFQVDNEPGLHLLHNQGVFTSFVARLKERYGTVSALNEAWGLTYWSHRLSSWDELWEPRGDTTPSYDLAWRRHQAELTAEFVAWQAGIVRRLARPGQYVTTCLAVTRPAVDEEAVCAPLDVTAGNVYYAAQDELALPDPGRRHEGGWFGQGVWQLYQSADRLWGARQEPFLVTETNATSIGGSHSNHPPYAGQLRQAAWALAARGARLVQYWHWHSLPFGAETYWGGVLGHGYEPGRVHDEVARTAREFEAAGLELTGLVPDADAVFVRSVDSDWAMQCQPPLARPGTSAPDPGSYGRIFGAFYQAFFDAGVQARVVSPDQLHRLLTGAGEVPRVLVVPALYVADDETLTLLGGYARSGGHLVLTFRTGYADEEARARSMVAPGLLRKVAGVRCEEYANLTGPLPLAGTSELDLGPGAHAEGWADALVEEGARPLAHYRHPHFGQWPAATVREHGRGRVTWVGTLPDAESARALAASVAGGATRRAPWEPLPASVTVTSARNSEGARLWFVHNWSWQPTRITVPEAVRDVLGTEHVAAGEALDLGPWDVRVLCARSGHGVPPGATERSSRANDRPEGRS